MSYTAMLHIAWVFLIEGVGGLFPPAPFFYTFLCCFQIIVYFCPQETIKRIQYEEAFPIHDIDGAAVGG